MVESTRFKYCLGTIYRGTFIKITFEICKHKLSYREVATNFENVRILSSGQCSCFHEKYSNPLYTLFTRIEICANFLWLKSYTPMLERTLCRYRISA